MMHYSTYIRCCKVITWVLILALMSTLLPRQALSSVSHIHTAYAAEMMEISAQSNHSSESPMDLLRHIGTVASSNDDYADRSNKLVSLVPTVHDSVDTKSFAPDTLNNPLIISRTQSALKFVNQATSTLVVTFTVTNQQSRVLFPQVPMDLTTILSNTEALTQAVNSLLTFNPANDPHTLRNVLLTESLNGVATFIDASPEPDRSGLDYAWSLGDIPPSETVTATLTLLVPTSVTDFIDVDVGASAWGTLLGRSVHAQAQPIHLAPHLLDNRPIDDWLKRTIDADTGDQYMLAKAAELGQDPIRLFEYVRSLGYESYTGSLRGTRGTLWSKAGNSVDKSSLLIAMLRASGIPARYRHGRLDKSLAQTLILSMFPASSQLLGHVPPGTQVNDPMNDPKLLEETQNHWWVEAYLPEQGWRNLDPSSSDTNVGQQLVQDGDVATDSTDRIAEIPDYLRHKVTMRVKVQHLESFPPTNELPVSYPLDTLFNTVELVGRPVTLSHLVNTFDSSRDNGFCQCGVFRLIEHTYTPYFRIGDRIIKGQSFQEMYSNFPFGANRVIGEWLLFSSKSPNGDTEEFEREVVDRVGIQGRQDGGSFSLGSDGTNEPFITDLDLFTTTFAPGQIRALL